MLFWVFSVLVSAATSVMVGLSATKLPVTSKLPVTGYILSSITLSRCNVWVYWWNPERCDHLNESYWTVLSCSTVYFAVHGGSNLWVCGWNPLNESYWAVLFCNAFVYALQDGSDFRVLRETPWVWPLIWKLPNSTFLWYCKVYT